MNIQYSQNYEESFTGSNEEIRLVWWKILTKIY
jgi:hypothetical protein